MALLVIDLLEAVQIKHEQSKWMTITPGKVKASLKVFLKAPAIVKPGKKVHAGLSIQVKHEAKGLRRALVDLLQLPAKVADCEQIISRLSCGILSCQGPGQLVEVGGRYVFLHDDVIRGGLGGVQCVDQHASQPFQLMIRGDQRGHDVKNLAERSQQDLVLL